jgi:hypothetical protein
MLPGVSSWKAWFFAALLIKSLFFVYKINERTVNPGPYETFMSIAGDTDSYIEPIENLLSKGEYYNDYRMPGYGSVYMLPRLVLSQTAALNTMGILQLLVSALSVYVLALACYRITGSTGVFLSVYFLYAISTFVSLFDFWLLTETFCTAALIFAFYFAVKSGSEVRNTMLSGFFVTWAIFLKPAMAPLIAIYAGYFLIRNHSVYSSPLVWSYKSLLIFLIPFILIDGSWMARNYFKYGEIKPLTRTVYYPTTEASYLGSLYRFMSSFGGSIVHWNPGSEITFFLPVPSSIKNQQRAELPENIYTSKFNRDSLVVLRDIIAVINDPATDETAKAQMNAVAKAKFDEYAASVLEERPFLYHIESRIRAFKNFFFHSGTYNLFEKSADELNWGQFGAKVFYSVFYLLVVLGGLSGALFLLVRGLSRPEWLLPALTGLYAALVFPLGLKTSESRYFVPAYPFFLISAILLFFEIRRLYLKIRS